MTLTQAITQVRRFLASQHRRGIGNRHGPVNRRTCAATLHQRDGTTLRLLRFLGLTRIRRTLVARA